MIRSGSTLQFQLSAAIVEQAGMGRRLPYAPESDFDHICPQDNVPSEFRVFKVHVYTPAFSKECNENGARVVYSYRDIRDVAVSAMRKFDMSFGQLMEAKWLEQAIADYYHWTKCPLACIGRYEDFVGDISGEAEKINRFLGLPLTLQDISRLAEKFSVAQQLVQIQKIKEQNGSAIFPNEIVFDPVELLHHNHIYQGKVGGWREILSDSEKMFLTDKFSVWLEENEYDLKIW
jgi:hypothetical protein